MSSLNTKKEKKNNYQFISAIYLRRMFIHSKIIHWNCNYVATWGERKKVKSNNGIQPSI